MIVTDSFKKSIENGLYSATIVANLVKFNEVNISVAQVFELNFCWQSIYHWSMTSGHDTQVFELLNFWTFELKIFKNFQLSGYLIKLKAKFTVEQ